MLCSLIPHVCICTFLILHKQVSQWRGGVGRLGLVGEEGANMGPETTNKQTIRRDRNVKFSLWTKVTGLEYRS